MITSDIGMLKDIVDYESKRFNITFNRDSGFAIYGSNPYTYYTSILRESPVTYGSYDFVNDMMLFRVTSGSEIIFKNYVNYYEDDKK